MRKNYKHCPECDTTKQITDFYKDRRRHDGLQGRCKECSKARSKQHYELNREKIAAYNRDYYRRHKAITRKEPTTP